MIGPIYRKRIIRHALGALGHEERRHDFGWPAGARVVLHPRHRALAVDRHTQNLDGGRPERVKARVVGAREDHLYGLADRLRSQRGAHGIVAVEATPETTAEPVGA